MGREIQTKVDSFFSAIINSCTNRKTQNKQTQDHFREIVCHGKHDEHTPTTENGGITNIKTEVNTRSGR